MAQDHSCGCTDDQTLMPNTLVKSTEGSRELYLEADVEVRVWGNFFFFLAFCSQTWLHSAMLNDSAAGSSQPLKVSYKRTHSLPFPQHRVNTSFKL